jgi:hypothetical protein
VIFSAKGPISPGSALGRSGLICACGRRFFFAEQIKCVELKKLVQERGNRRMSPPNGQTPNKPNPNILSEEMRKPKPSEREDHWLEGFIERLSEIVQHVTGKK